MKKEYEHDIFYKVDNLSLDKKISILKDATESCYQYHVDKLDCSISWARQRIDMSFGEVMEKFDNSCHFVVILRRGFEYEKNKGEIGFSTMTGISFYLFIYLEVSELNKIIEKYSLKSR